MTRNLTRERARRVPIDSVIGRTYNIFCSALLGVQLLHVRILHFNGRSGYNIFTYVGMFAQNTCPFKTSGVELHAEGPGGGSALPTSRRESPDNGETMHILAIENRVVGASIV